MSDFDIGGWLGNLFGGSPADPTDPTDPTKLTAAGKAANPDITGWLNKNSGALSGMAGGMGQAIQQNNKPAQVAPMQLTAAPMQRPQVQVPQITGMLNTPVAPPNPFMAGR